MRLLRSVRWLLLALVVTLIPVSSHAGVFISVGFAPPVLPVYVQPPCPEPGLMWTPGYWAYGPDGYYWVPGTWVPAPYAGALWTPGYWGWSGGLFVFHDGYWGRHIGYYGGVNYGFGYGGIGFAGGEWRGGVFAYNTAVMHVGFHGGVTFEDRVRVERGFVARDSHVAFSGGPGGIRHDPAPEERMAEREQHTARTSFQQQHESVARTDRNSYVKNNGGRPQNPAVARPLGGGARAQPGNNPMRGGAQNNVNPQPNMQHNAQPQQRNVQPQQTQQRNAQPRQFQQRNVQPQQPQQRNVQPQQQQRPAAQPQSHQPAESHAAPKPQAAPKDEHKR
jgi:hypothetical protein